MHYLIKSMCLSFSLVICALKDTTAELKLLNVVFRHGDRAPDDNGLEFYPRDPYVNDTFWPIELGGLTNTGKLREYTFGEYLRKHYGHFLGDTYVPSEVSARSTNVDRTKMSLQLVLAALYAPKNLQKWKDNLNWQPIPAYFLAKLDDVLMIPEECPKYLKAREKVESSPEVKAKVQSFQSFMQWLSSKTGKNISNSNDMYFLYHGLMAEKSLGLSLPEWTESVFPRGRLLNGINLEYEIFSYNAEMKRLNGGMFVRKFIENMIANRTSSLEQRHKIFLYSGHETNIAAVLQALGVYYPHVPAYSSAVITELHEINNEHFVKVIYYKGITESNEEIAEEMRVPGCSKKCSLKRFAKVLKNVTPSNDDILSCNKRSLRQTFAKNKIHIAPGIIKQIIDKLDAEDNVRSLLLH